MKKPDKKRSAIYSVVALMLCTAVYLNWSYTTFENDQIVSHDTNFGETILVDMPEEIPITAVIKDDTQDSFATAKLTRTTARDEAIAILNETINSEQTTQDAKNLASESVAVISSNALAEGAIETVMTAKGFDKSVVFISEDGVNVLVSKLEGEFTATDAAIIKDVVMSQTIVPASKIKIIETN